MLIKCAFVGHKKLLYLSKCTVLQQQKFSAKFMLLRARGSEGMENNLKFTILENKHILQ
jgi:hypothetical protein